MARTRDERAEYVVELQVSGVAVVSVRAESPNDAAALAEERVRPADVTDIEEVTSTIVAKVSEAAVAVGAPPSSVLRERASKGLRSVRQA